MSRYSMMELARSLELYNLHVDLNEKSKKEDWQLVLTKEPYLRKKEDVSKVVVAFGSYDPLSIGHEQLFMKGLQTARGLPENPSRHKDLDELVIVTSIAHYEKKVNLFKNSTIYDRMHALEGFASSMGNVSLALFNNPYFSYLMPALEDTYGKDVQLYFVVGADVMEKIVDRPAYEKGKFDMDKIVEQLMHHTFLVTDRFVTYKDKPGRNLELSRIIAENPILEQYRNSLVHMELDRIHPRLKIPIEEVSSTKIRELRSKNEDAANLEAIGVSDFVDRRNLYVENSYDYPAFVCARQMFADHYRSRGDSIKAYLHELRDFLEKMDSDEQLKKELVTKYLAGNGNLYHEMTKRE